MVTFQRTSGNSPEPAARLGVVCNDQIIDLANLFTAVNGQNPPKCFLNMQGFLNEYEEAKSIILKLINKLPGKNNSDLIFLNWEQVQLNSPLPRPLSIRDCMVFEKHAIQATQGFLRRYVPWVWHLDQWKAKLTGKGFLNPAKVWYQQPVYYKGNPASVVGSGALIQWPAYAESLDYELEIGIFIGRKGKNIPVDQAGQYIAGYTIFNDFSARDTQWREMAGRLGPAKGKDFDTGNAIGPWLVTPEDIADPHNLNMVARINGKAWSLGNTRDMHFTFEQIIAYISKEETLYPGDFIGGGTVGNGCGLELNRWLKPGDVIELEIEGLGKLTNSIEGRK
jgi:2-keto-4-pentenoate hydratase/2-oxohepta-3-ene-1,7-dioic acid hydratase in catechol pathway